MAEFYHENPISRLEDLETRVQVLENLISRGLFSDPSSPDMMTLPGGLSLNPSGEEIVIEEGSQGGTEVGYLKVRFEDGTEGYVRIYGSP